MDTSSDWSGQGTKHVAPWDSRPDLRNDTRMEFNGLPPYDPTDGTLPPLPTTPVDGATLQVRYGLSKAAFHHRKTDLHCIQGVRKGKRVFFLPREVYLLDATHWYMEKGYTLSEIREALEGFDTSNLEVAEGVDEEVVTVEVTGGSTVTHEGGKTDTLSVSPQTAQLAGELSLLMYQAFETMVQKAPDPLRTLRYLREAADNNYLISNKMLGECLELSKNTIQKWGETEQRHGFQFTRVGRLKWRVRQMTDEEIAAAEHLNVA